MAGTEFTPGLLHPKFRLFQIPHIIFLIKTIQTWFWTLKKQKNLKRQFMGSQRVGHDLVTEKQKKKLKAFMIKKQNTIYLHFREIHKPC